MIYVEHAATQVEWTENGTFMNWAWAGEEGKIMIIIKRERAGVMKLHVILRVMVSSWHEWEKSAPERNKDVTFSPGLNV